MHLNECFEKRSAFSAVECIAADWFVKTKTIFYIPDDAYAGYTYLSEDIDYRSQPPQTVGGAINARQQQHHHSPHQRRHHAFVEAKEMSGLHHHHHHHFYHHNFNRSIAMQTNNGGQKLSSHAANVTSTLTPPNVNYHTSFTHMPLGGSQQTMTVPYMHPELGVPIPPLELPWFFAALCFSFTLGGVMKFYWLPRWTKHGGGVVNGQYQRHWFPYRAFALILILIQGPCSFFADYVHMTNESLWHMVDRWLACTSMALHLGEIICIYRFTRPIIYALYVGCTAIAVINFLKSQHAQASLDTDAFIFWHNCWHCFPLTLIAVCWLENVLNRRFGEYYPFELQRGEKGGVLLSSIAIEQVKSEVSTPSKSAQSLRRSRRLAGKHPPGL